VAGAPVLDVPAINLHSMAVQRALAEAPLTPAKVQHLSAVVQQKCDVTDGISDGIVEDPRRCVVDVAKEVPACAEGTSSDTCLTRAERDVLAVFSRPLSANGTTIYPAFPTGTGILAPAPTAPGASIGYWLGTNGQPAVSATYVDSFFKEVGNGGVAADWRALDPEAVAKAVTAAGSLLTAKEPDLSRFRARGAKLMLYHGWAEPQLSPMLTLDYVDSVRRTMTPPVDDFLRVFMVPGMLHCQGRVGVDTFDLISPLIQWVEGGPPPSRVEASRQAGGGGAPLSRPLCSYPQIAKYTGSGSTSDAANFVCTAP
jgi:feruloyl esterase